jgi:hypothetical protein
MEIHATALANSSIDSNHGGLLRPRQAPPAPSSDGTAGLAGPYIAASGSRW